MADEPAPAPDLDPSDPYTREAQTFPRLNREMAARIRGYGRVEDVAGECQEFCV